MLFVTTQRKLPDTKQLIEKEIHETMAVKWRHCIEHIMKEELAHITDVVVDSSINNNVDPKNEKNDTYDSLIFLKSFSKSTVYGDQSFRQIRLLSENCQLYYKPYFVLGVRSLFKTWYCYTKKSDSIKNCLGRSYLLLGVLQQDK